MSTLDSVCAASDDLAKMVLQYLDLRGRGDSLAAARVRKRFDAAANAALGAAAAARRKRDDALTQWTPSGPQPLPARPANDHPQSMPDSIA